MDPEFMQKMKTLKWSKDEQFIKTPEYETRKRALLNNCKGSMVGLVIHNMVDECEGSLKYLPTVCASRVSKTWFRFSGTLCYCRML